MPDHWNTLGSYNFGCITLHTLNVVYRTVKDPLYPKLSKSEQNILKWAALLHDIVKRGDPLFKGKDHVHPFLSAKATLIIFRNLGIIDLEDSEKKSSFEEIISLIEESE
jgi:hypothetical protein